MAEEVLASERDFYRRLLDLGSQDELEPLIDQALALIVEVTGATTAYLELHDDDASAPRYWKGHRLSENALASIRESISRGIIARAISEGRTVETPSASLDARFSELGSVRQHDIQAVLCAPVGVPPIGVIYLQGRNKPGMFSQVDRERAELFARQLAPLADRLLRHGGRDRDDFTREVRGRLVVPEIVGRSRALAQLLQSASHVAHLDVDVLITGPSGTGKSVLARAIANNSPRAKGPFVELNCAAIPENLIESELFGAERGAHSTATRKTVGKVAAAEGGTLFLDEIAELSAGAQAKLLKLLETREYHPLGSSTAVKANVRIISATNADLEERVRAKQFREDLFYRLHVVPIEVPGIDLRREDIPELVEHFCDEACKRHKLSALVVSRRALAACKHASWPGHTRQLKNAIEAAVIRAHGEKSTTLREVHVFPKVTGKLGRTGGGGAAAGGGGVVGVAGDARGSGGPGTEAGVAGGRGAGAREDEADDAYVPPTLHEITREAQRRAVLEALERTDWNVSEAARELDLARSHLYNLINEFELRRIDAKGRQ